MKQSALELYFLLSSKLARQQFGQQRVDERGVGFARFYVETSLTLRRANGKKRKLELEELLGHPYLGHQKTPSEPEKAGAEYRNQIKAQDLD